MFVYVGRKRESVELPKDTTKLEVLVLVADANGQGPAAHYMNWATYDEHKVPISWYRSTAGPVGIGDFLLEPSSFAVAPSRTGDAKTCIVNESSSDAFSNWLATKVYTGSKEVVAMIVTTESIRHGTAVHRIVLDGLQSCLSGNKIYYDVIQNLLPEGCSFADKVGNYMRVAWGSFVDKTCIQKSAP